MIVVFEENVITQRQTKLELFLRGKMAFALEQFV